MFIERLWRSLKYKDVYLKGYGDGREANAGIGRRPHQALAGRTPMAVWRDGLTATTAVDMMDNARALPTCPQPHQQQQTERLAA